MFIRRGPYRSLKIMTNWRIHPHPVSGTIHIPSSKSHTMRALVFGLMGHGKTTIHYPLNSPDVTAMLQAIQGFGAKVIQFPSYIEIVGVGGKLTPATSLIDCGNSGLVLRLMGAISTLCSERIILTGDHSIQTNRPISPLLDALTQLKAYAISTHANGRAPIEIQGPLFPGTISMNGEDSQPVSALLIATAFLPGPTEIFVHNPGEKPWIDLTLNWMHRLGIRVEHHNHSHYVVHGNATYNGFEYLIPGDFSSAAFPIAAALITQSELTLENIDRTDCQGDQKLIDVLISMGAKIETDPKTRTLRVKRGGKLKGACLDINDFIDALPILAVIGCFCEGKTEIVNAAIAREKESDRIHAICTELKKMGAHIEEKPDGMIVHHSPLYGAVLNSHQDHRIALSLAVAALGAQGETLIEGTDCTAKTYPTFASDFGVFA